MTGNPKTTYYPNQLVGGLSEQLVSLQKQLGHVLNATTSPCCPTLCLHFNAVISNCRVATCSGKRINSNQYIKGVMAKTTALMSSLQNHQMKNEFTCLLDLKFKKLI